MPAASVRIEGGGQADKHLRMMAGDRPTQHAPATLRPAPVWRWWGALALRILKAQGLR